VDVPEQNLPEKYWYITLPPALLVLYERTAESYTEPPTAITEFGWRVAIIVTVPVVTVTVLVTVTVVVEDDGAAAMVGLFKSGAAVV
jgi:hypothetical protein